MTSRYSGTARGSTQDGAVPPDPRGPIDRRGWLVVAVVLAVQLIFVLLAVLPQLSPRISGTELTLRVAPVDPIDPFRGAYVDLRYPDLPDPAWQVEQVGDEPSDEAERGAAYVPLVQEGDVWVGGEVQRSRPEGLYLTCDDSSWRLTCGIESWFVGQNVAAEIEASMREEDALATVRVDRWGHATITDLQPAR